MSRGVGRRRGSNPILLWLWCSLAAVAPIHPLTWEPPCASSVALKSGKKKKNLTAAALVTVEMWVPFSAQQSGLKDPALLQWRPRSRLWLRFGSQSRSFRVLCDSPFPVPLPLRVFTDPMN